jgi:polyhydroxyalkanoate synthesis regulator phasin
VENPLADNRLKKMAAQKTTKSVLDYIRQNCAKGALLQAQQQGEEVVRNGGKKGKQNLEEAEEVVDELADRMTVLAISQTNPEIIVTSAGRR